MENGLYTSQYGQEVFLFPLLAVVEAVRLARPEYLQLAQQGQISALHGDELRVAPCPQFAGPRACSASSLASLGILPQSHPSEFLWSHPGLTPARAEALNAAAAADGTAPAVHDSSAPHRPSYQGFPRALLVVQEVSDLMDHRKCGASASWVDLNRHPPVGHGELPMSVHKRGAYDGDDWKRTVFMNPINRRYSVAQGLAGLARFYIQDVADGPDDRDLRGGLSGKQTAQEVKHRTLPGTPPPRRPAWGARA